MFLFQRQALKGDREDTRITVAGLAGFREKEALQADVEKKIQALVEKKDGITADFVAMMDAYTAQEVNERTVSATAAKYNTPMILSGAFAVKAIKTAGPVCAVGFMVCMVLLVISRRKEEKSRARKNG